MKVTRMQLRQLIESVVDEAPAPRGKKTKKPATPITDKFVEVSRLAGEAFSELWTSLRQSDPDEEEPGLSEAQGQFEELMDEIIETTRSYELDQ